MFSSAISPTVSYTECSSSVVSLAAVSMCVQPTPLSPSGEGREHAASVDTLFTVLHVEYPWAPTHSLSRHHGIRTVSRITLVLSTQRHSVVRYFCGWRFGSFGSALLGRARCHYDVLPTRKGQGTSVHPILVYLPNGNRARRCDCSRDRLS